MSLSLPAGVLQKEFPYGSPGFALPAGVVTKTQNYTVAVAARFPAARRSLVARYGPKLLPTGVM